MISALIRIVVVLVLTHSSLVMSQTNAERDVSGDWPRLLGNRFDGSVSQKPNFDVTKKPRFVWSLDVGDGYGLGAVSDGKYYHFDAVKGPSGETLERLRSIDLETGETIWESSIPQVYQDMYGYEDGPRSTPTLSKDSVFTLGVSGMLICRDRETSKERWKVDTNKEFGVVQNFFGVGSSPLLIDHKVIVMIGGSPVADANIAPGRLDRVSPNGSLLVAFDSKTGKELWRSGDDLASYSSPRSFEFNGRMFVLVYARDHLWCIDPVDGNVLWKYAHRADILESAIAMTPVVDGEHIFISECYQIGSVLLRAKQNEVASVWKDPAFDRRRQSMRSHWATPILVDGFLYGCSGRNAPDSDFRCINWKTGKVAWSDDRRARCSITRVGDHFILLEERGLLQVVKANPDKFELIYEWALHESGDDVQSDDDVRPAIEYPCWAAPIIVGNRMLVRGDKRVLSFKW